MVYTNSGFITNYPYRLPYAYKRTATGSMFSYHSYWLDNIYIHKTGGRYHKYMYLPLIYGTRQTERKRVLEEEISGRNITPSKTEKSNPPAITRAVDGKGV
jgi:hypothetical protein